MDNSYSSPLDNSKGGGGQSLFRCDICYKEFLYENDFAFHMRYHMDQMQQLQQTMPQRPYTGPPSNYSVPASSAPVSNQLEGMLQSYNSEPGLHSTHGQRGTPQPGLHDQRGTPQPGLHDQRGTSQPGLHDQRGTSQPGLHDQRGTSQPGLHDQRGTPQPGLHDQRGTPQPGLHDQRGTPQPGLHDQRGTPQLGLHDQRGTPQPGLHDQRGTPQPGLHDQRGTPQPGLHDQRGTPQPGLHDQRGTPQPGLHDQRGTPQPGLHDQRGTPQPGLHDQRGTPQPRLHDQRVTSQPVVGPPLSGVLDQTSTPQSILHLTGPPHSRLQDQRGTAQPVLLSSHDPRGVHQPGLHSSHDQREPSQPGPVTDTDKHQYRMELERDANQLSRHVDVRPHPASLNVERTLISDNKMTPEPRPVPAVSHNVQNASVASLLQSTVGSYLPDQNKSLVGGTNVSYSTQRPLVSDDYRDTRKHVLPKVMDSQPYNKPSPYYMPPSQYGLSHGLYYQPPHVPSHTPMDYYSHPTSTPGDRKVPGFYYGQPPLSAPSASIPEYPPYNVAMSHTGQLPDSRGQLGGKVSEQVEIGRTYPSGHLSPPSSHPDMYKRGVSQPPEYNVVPSHMPPSQQDFNLYKLSADLSPSVNIDTRPPVPETVCHICMLPCSNSVELAEHMKSHARERSQLLPKPVATSIPITTPVTQVYNKQMQGNTSISMASTGPSAFYQHHINSQSSTSAASFSTSTESSAFSSTFPDNKLPVNTVKPHTEEIKFKCRFCPKDFDKHSKCFRHEALHQRDINLFYCEICEESFKYKGNYLFHMQKQHETLSSTLQAETVVNCQVCEEEVDKTKLVAHLKSHPVKHCDKCDRVFEQKAEYVEHLMNEHRQELGDTSEGTVDNTESDGADRSESERELSDEKDSGLEEDHDKDIEEQSNDDATSDKGQLLTLDEHTNVTKETLDVRVRKEKKQMQQPMMKNLKDNVIIARQMEERKAEMKAKKLAEESNNSSSISVSPSHNMKLKFSCSKCDKSFSNKDELSLHVETHRKDPTRVYCEICDLSYNMKDKGYYIYHMKYHTMAEVDRLPSLPAKIKCQICSTLMANEKFVSHMREAHAKFNCDICKWSYSTEGTLLVHMKRIHGGNKKCVVVKKSDGEVSVEEKHVPVVYKKLKDIKAEQQSKKQVSADSQFTCKICAKSFDKKANFDRHMKINHLKADGLHIYCEICNAPFLSRGTYLFHIQKDHFDSNFISSQGNKKSESEKCVANDKVDKTRKQEGSESDAKLVDSNRAKQEGSESDAKLVDSNKAKIDEKELINKIQVKVKRTVLNPETGNFEEKLVEEEEDAPSNPEISDNQVFMNEGKPTVSSDVPDSSKPSVVVSDIVYCKLCNMSLKKQMVFDHMKTHTVFNCDLCEYTFTKKPAYLTHKRSLHLDDFIADEISSVLALNSSKDLSEPGTETAGVEQKNADTKKRKRMGKAKFFTCLLCEVEFKQDKYVEHIKTHQKVKMPCQFCDRLFSKKNLLVLHERSHNRISHKLDELPYPKSCPICDCKMSSRSQYVEHIREHTGKRAIKCKKCDTRFTSESNLDNHNKVYHDTYAKIIWKLDGEGMKFDLRIGRVTEVMSDYLGEIKEINEQLLSNGKSEIWIGSTLKKAKDKMANVNKKVKEADSENVKETDTPKRLTRKRLVKTEKDGEAADDDNEEEEDDTSLRRSKRRHSLKKNESENETDKGDEEEEEEEGSREKDDDDEYKIEEDEDEDEDEADDETTQDEEEDLSPRTRRRTRSGYASDDSESTGEKYTPKGTRTRRSGNLSNSSPNSRSNKSIETGSKRKSIVTRTDVVKRLRRSTSALSNDQKDKTPGQEKEKSHFCPMCKQGFTRFWNMKQHAKDKHHVDISPQAEIDKSSDNEATKSPIVGKLRTRATNLTSELGKPASSSTPVKKTTKELVVQISPLDVDTLLNKSTESVDLSSKTEGYTCQYCNKSIQRKWNYQKHLEYHERKMNISKEQDTSVESLSHSAIEKSEISDVNMEVEGGKVESSKRTRSMSQQAKNGTGNQNASTDPVRFVCEICNKSIANSKWHFTRHLKIHQKEGNIKSGSLNKVLKENGKDSEPFPCKDCPEAFKKKRDLYIHAKIHMEGSQEEGTENSLLDLSGKSEGDTKDSSSASLSQASGINTTELSASLSNESDVEGMTSNKSGVNEETDENKNEKDHQSNKSQKEICARQVNLDSNNKEPNASVQTDLMIDSKRKINDLEQDEFNDHAKDNYENVGGGRRKYSKSNNPKGDFDVTDKASDPALSDRGSESPSLPSSHSSTSSEHEDKERGRSSKNPRPVVKMSSKSAISKWKAKVQMTLSSQLELNQAKKQALLENPEIARVKGYLSVSGKPERKNFECRLCGISVHEESEFRSHMDVHLNQSPPYCSICDIYFMAIYPMRRLAEHNRKKHQELTQKSTSS